MIKYKKHYCRILVRCGNDATAAKNELHTQIGKGADMAVDSHLFVHYIIIVIYNFIVLFSLNLHKLYLFTFLMQ